MGGYIVQLKDFDRFCEVYHEAIVDRVEEKHSTPFYDSIPEHQKWFDEEANALWESVEGDDPNGGDSDED